MIRTGKATQRIEKYGKIVEYFTVPFTRSSPYPTYRVQAVMGHYRDVGIGKTYEDAKEAAAERVLDKYCDTKTPDLNKIKNLKKMNEKLEKELKTLELSIKEFAIEKIDLIINKIENGAKPIGGFDAHDLHKSAEEILAKMGFTLKVQEYEKQGNCVCVMMIESQDFPTRYVVELGTDEIVVKMKGLMNILFSEKWRLFAQIEKQIEEERVAREKRFLAKAENKKTHRDGRRRRRN